MGGRDSPGASLGTVVVSDIGDAQGQSRREQGRGAPRGRLGESWRELGRGAPRGRLGTVPARAGERRAASGLRDSPGASSGTVVDLRYRKRSGTVDVDSQRLHTLNGLTSGGMNVMRSYQGYYTRSHQNSEVKRLWAGIVLGWVTSREVPVLHPVLISFQTKIIHFANEKNIPGQHIPGTLDTLWRPYPERRIPGKVHTRNRAYPTKYKSKKQFNCHDSPSLDPISKKNHPFSQ